MSTTAMVCRNCGASLEAGRIDERLGVVSCAHCGGLHALAAAERPAEADTAPGGRASPSAGRAARVPIERPARFEVHRGAGTLQVRWPRGGKVGVVVLVLFALCWGVGAASAGLFFLVPVSLPLLYLAAVRGLNRTTLRVETGHVVVTQGPLPWPGARRVPRADIVQLFASERVSRTRSGSDGAGRIEERRSYRLVQVDRAGGRRTLVGGMSRPEPVLWLERELEAVLGIADAAVAGEYR